MLAMILGSKCTALLLGISAVLRAQASSSVNVAEGSQADVATTTGEREREMDDIDMLDVEEDMEEDFVERSAWVVSWTEAKEEEFVDVDEEDTTTEMVTDEEPDVRSSMAIAGSSYEKPTANPDIQAGDSDDPVEADFSLSTPPQVKPQVVRGASALGQSVMRKFEDVPDVGAVKTGGSSVAALRAWRALRAVPIVSSAGLVLALFYLGVRRWREEPSTWHEPDTRRLLGSDGEEAALAQPPMTRCEPEALRLLGTDAEAALDE